MSPLLHLRLPFGTASMVQMAAQGFVLASLRRSNLRTLSPRSCLGTRRFQISADRCAMNTYSIKCSLSPKTPHPPGIVRTWIAMHACTQMFCPCAGPRGFLFLRQPDVHWPHRQVGHVVAGGGGLAWPQSRRLSDGAVRRRHERQRAVTWQRRVRTWKHLRLISCPAVNRCCHPRSVKPCQRCSYTSSA